MARLKIGLMWAAVTIVMALAVRFGIVDRDAGQIMLLVLPVLGAIEVTRGSTACSLIERRPRVTQ